MGLGKYWQGTVAKPYNTTMRTFIYNCNFDMVAQSKQFCYENAANQVLSGFHNSGYIQVLIQ